MTKQNPVLRVVSNEAEVRGCFRLMQQLRPHLTSETEFLDRWLRQTAEGYLMAGLFNASTPVALTGYRVQENLVHGRFLYVDDLVTDEALRGSGYGEQLMAYLREQARAFGCGKLVLDTPLSNSLGHRFYFRCGLLASALRFNVPIET
jgi:GNAT superfamily N-acetyltransferase